MNDTDNRWVRRGFNADQPTNEFLGCFTKAEAQASLFESTRFEPKLVYLTHEDDDVRLPIVLDLARPLYLDEEIGKTSAEPNWYFEGWVFEPGTPSIQRVRIHVATMDYDSEFSGDDIFTWQWIEETPDRLPLDASIRKLGLNGRTYTLFRRAGLATIGDVIEYAKRHDFIAEIQTFGPALLADLKEKMAAAGYELPA